ncbi:hypothetical protein ScPMuIL_017543 [Solemya velum]
MAFWSFVVLVSLLVGYLGYQLYTPMPEGAEQPWQQNKILAFSTLTGLASLAAEKVGLDRLNTSRAIQHWLGDIRGSAVVDGITVRLYLRRRAFARQLKDRVLTTVGSCEPCIPFRRERSSNELSPGKKKSSVEPSHREEQLFVGGAKRLFGTPPHGEDNSLTQYDDLVFDGVKVRVFKPVDGATKSDQPALVFFHGGGFVFFHPNQYNLLTSTIASVAKLVVVSVDYRLAPEHPYPAGQEDCVTATKYMLRNAGKFGVDPNRIAVAGDSAGGNLAMSVALKLSKDRRENLPKIKAQVLIYPFVQGLTLCLPSFHIYGGTGSPSILKTFHTAAGFSLYSKGNIDLMGYFFNNKHISNDFKANALQMSYVDQKLLPAKYRREIECNADGNETVFEEIKHFILDPYFTPLMAADSDLKPLPKTYVLTAEYDTLRDEGFMLAQRLKNNGVDVVHIHWEHNFHGFLSFSGSLENGKQALHDVAEYLLRSV